MWLTPVDPATTVVTMTLAEALARQPAPRSVANARTSIREQLANQGLRIVVLDDDPTGTQTVHDVPVYTRWSADVLADALGGDERVVYLSTNSRSLEPAAAVRLGREIGAGLAEAARSASIRPEAVVPASRSDSTLRGHYPGEVDALLSGMKRDVDGVILAPAFFEGGRYTIDDVHWVEQEGRLVAAHETEFARDPVFGYSESNLRRWVEEKTGGAVRAADVLSVDLRTIRVGGPDAVTHLLNGARDGIPIVLNATCYDDLDTAVTGLIASEADGKRFAYRCAASFVKVRAGIEDRPLLAREQMVTSEAPGLIVMGSYVEKSTRQLEALLAGSRVRGIEVPVDRLVAGEPDSAIIRAAAEIDAALAAGRTAVCYTTRRRLETGAAGFLEAGRLIMDGMCRIIGSLEHDPAWLIAKGGITSIEMARTALGVTRATVLGQILPGVPVWKLGPQARWPGIPYVVFPGNVGDERALLRAVGTLSGSEVSDE